MPILDKDVTPEMLYDDRLPKPLSLDKFAKVSSVALHDKGLTARDKLVYIALCEYTNRNGLCWPSVKTIAEIASIGKTSVHLSLTVLEARGYIERKKRLRNSNVYRVSPIPINDLWRGQRDSFQSSENVENFENVDKSADYQAGENVENDSPRDGAESSPREARDRSINNALGERRGSAGVYFVDTDGERLTFDERTGNLRFVDTPSPSSEEKQNQEIEFIKRIWKESFPQSKTGFEKSKDEKVFRAYWKSNPCSSQFMKELTKMILKSPFLCGENQNGWRCSLFWALKKRTEIMKGKYLPVEMMSEQQKTIFKFGGKSK